VKLTVHTQQKLECTGPEYVLKVEDGMWMGMGMGIGMVWGMV